jgi:type IV pilus assembly protein PilB
MKTAERIEISPDLLTAITSEQAWHYRIIPALRTESEIHFYVQKNMVHADTIGLLELLLDRKVSLIHEKEENITQALQRYYRKSTLSASVQRVALNGTDDFVHKLVSEAKALGSSDIHIEIYDDKARIRIRIDGLLVERYKLEKSEYPALINKLKIKANLDIAEKRLPQDGRIVFQDDNKKFDIRISVLPTLHGEKVVMRLLSNDAANIYIENLGFSQLELSNYMEGIKRTHGIVLISGPTGSGKTTTLYATLKILNEEKRNILTVEDPIEYTLDGINQVQLKESIGLTFASALRTFLRQDPDVIMLGEIRDTETAQMAIRASLTGHLVLSTIHTNSAWGTISRLIDMGVPPFLLANTLTTSVAQRLVRKLCPDCKLEKDFQGGLPPSYNAPRKLHKIFFPVGCEVCHQTGYKGRKALYEVIAMDKELAEAIKIQKNEVSELLVQRKIKTLASNAFDLLESGESSLEETYPLLQID